MAELDYDQHSNSDVDISDDQTNSVGMLCDDILHYDIGDLVWAKVKSHPWWPGLVFDPPLASEEAKSMAKPGRILVAFYGDHTFSWLEHSQILAFKDYFKLKVKATTAKMFRSAVSEALDEVCWRAEASLQCSCRNKSLSNGNNLITKRWAEATPVRFEDVIMSKKAFNARTCLSFLKDVARSPCISFSSMYKATVLHGHALGLRTGLFANIGEDTLLGSNSEPFTLRTSVDMSESSLDASDRDAINDTTMKEQSWSEYKKRVNRESAFPVEDWRAKRRHVSEELSGKELKHSSEYCCGINIEVVLTSEGEPIGGAGPAFHCENHTREESGCVNQLTKQEISVLSELSRERISFYRTKLELKQKNLEATPCYLASFCNEKASNLLMQIFEELRFLAVDPLCSHGSRSRMARVVDAILSHRNFVFQKSSGYNTHTRSSGPQDGERIVGHFASEHGKANLETKAIRFCRPTNKKCRLYDVNSAETIDDQKRQMKTSDKGWDKTDAVPVLSSMKGVSQAHTTDIDSPKLDVHELLLEAQRKKSDLIERPAINSLGRKTGETNQERKDVNSEAFSGIRMDIKQSHETNEFAVNETFADATKSSVCERNVSSDGVGDNSGPPCVANTAEVSVPQHPLEISSGTGVCSVEQGSTMEPSQDTGVSYASDTGACSVGPGPTMGPLEYTRVDFTSDTGQRSTVEPLFKLNPLKGFCSQNVGISSHQSSENVTKSHLPVGLYMKFPSSFALPSEFQLNVFFTQFGALGSAGIRVFRETASAQVIFKHAKEAERAYRCVKEVSPFGDASVVFRLQYFAHL